MTESHVAQLTQSCVVVTPTEALWTLILYRKVSAIDLSMPTNQRPSRFEVVRDTFEGCQKRFEVLNNSAEVLAIELIAPGGTVHERCDKLVETVEKGQLALKTINAHQAILRQFNIAELVSAVLA